MHYRWKSRKSNISSSRSIYARFSPLSERGRIHSAVCGRSKTPSGTKPGKWIWFEKQKWILQTYCGNPPTVYRKFIVNIPLSFEKEVALVERLEQPDKAVLPAYQSVRSKRWEHFPIHIQQSRSTESGFKLVNHRGCRPRIHSATARGTLTHHRPMICVFIDIGAAFDSVNRLHPINSLPI